MQITSKLPDVGTSIFTRIGMMASKYQCLNLAQGFPNFGVDPRLPELIDQHTKAGKNQYAPATGVTELRRAISRKKELLYGYAPNPDTEITVTIGATEAIFSSIQALVHPGDEVIYFEPAYDSYVPAIRLAGGQPIALSLNAPDFEVNWDEVRQKINERTRLIIINNPHNPSGTIWSEADMHELQQLLEGTNILLLSDEVYQHLVYDGQIHHSVLRYPKLYRRAVVTMSFGKTFHATGWRVGYAIAPPEISAELRRIHQFNTFSAYTPVQYALADYLAEPEHYLQLPEQFQARRDRFLAGLSKASFQLLPSAGTYFVCADFSDQWSGSDLELAERLITEHGIAAIPMGEFYEDKRKTGLLRFCFAKDEKTLDEAAEILTKIVIR
ncbi:methionine aminotransferase [Lewinellaceae bacterium SD302]|nr:methionine aminotransferase [Lewinellaceae bacterium SD302]